MPKEQRIQPFNREVYRFGQTVAASTGWTETASLRIPGDGTLERLYVRMYIGAQLDLRLRPWIKRKRGKDFVYESIVKFSGTKDYIDGDDDAFAFETGIPVYLDDEIVIEYKNEDTVNSYDFAVDITVDFAFGALRVPVYGAMKGAR